MKPAEKLKRIKLISEQIYINVCSNTFKETYLYPKDGIKLAKEFVTEFEKFESEFLKEHEVKDENTKDD